jgi:hypothetical protein
MSSASHWLCYQWHLCPGGHDNNGHLGYFSEAWRPFGKTITPHLARCLMGGLFDDRDWNLYHQIGLRPPYSEHVSHEESPKTPPPISCPTPDHLLLGSWIPKLLLREVDSRPGPIAMPGHLSNKLSLLQNSKFQSLAHQVVGRKSQCGHSLRANRWGIVKRSGSQWIVCRF